MSEVLVSWLGHADLRAVEGSATVGVGPVAEALEAVPFDTAFLLTDHDAEPTDYLRWLNARAGGTEITVLREQLTGPTEFGEIDAAAVRVCEQALATNPESALTFHLSPGTPAMAAVWVILAKTRFPAAMIESSREHGVRTASVPFDISADFLPDLLRQPDRELERLSAGLPPEAPEFDAIVHRSPVMQRVILRARRVAPRSVSVLLEGETAADLLHARSEEAETLHYLGGMLGFNETFDSRIARWVDQLDAGVPPEGIDASGVDALQAQLVIEACVRSFERSEVVEVGALS